MYRITFVRKVYEFYEGLLIYKTEDDINYYCMGTIVDDIYILEILRKLYSENKNKESD